MRGLQPRAQRRRPRQHQVQARRRGGAVRGMRPHPRAHLGVRHLMAPRSVRIEADGGSRGNPGRAAYGAVLFDAETGKVIAEQAATIGIATNNVAEYSGLIAGLELYHQHAEGAELEVRMDSKL